MPEYPIRARWKFEKRRGRKLYVRFVGYIGTSKDRIGVVRNADQRSVWIDGSDGISFWAYATNVSEISEEEYIQIAALQALGIE